MRRLRDTTDELKRREQVADALTFVRLMLRHKGDPMAALGEAEHMYSRSRPAVVTVLRSAISAGSTTDPTWASTISVTSLMAALVSLISERTILGQMPFRRALFDTRMFGAAEPGSAGYVAEGEPIPVMGFDASTITLPQAKIGGIAVFTDELIRAAGAASLGEIRRVIVSVLARAMDVALLDPDIAAVAGKNPASLTNSGTLVPSTGSDEASITADLEAMLQAAIDAGSDLQGGAAFVTDQTTALHLSTLLTAGGSRAFPGASVVGGELLGLPLHVTAGKAATGSPSEGTLALIDPNGVIVADEGTMTVAASSVSALQMDGAPSTGPQSLVSLMQTHATALRMVRYLNFSAVAGSVHYLRTAY
jgi:HK97 family phage major capsid protein